ncbi:MAG: hypothetical protein WBF93_10360 [Pirellulales bacterium]
MPFLPFHYALCWLLSALMFAGTGVPTAFEHFHADGDVSHEHESLSPLGCTASTQHDHSDDDGATQTRVAVFTSDVSHAHVNWFGIQLHWPNPNAPSHDDNEQQSPAETVISTLAQLFTLSIQSNCSGHQTMNAIAVALGEESVCVRQTIRASAPVIFPPLCDSARRELTGVLRC